MLLLYIRKDNRITYKRIHITKNETNSITRQKDKNLKIYKSCCYYFGTIVNGVLKI